MNVDVACSIAGGLIALAGQPGKVALKPPS
jgi:hypothetical protein